MKQLRKNIVRSIGIEPAVVLALVGAAFASLAAPASTLASGVLAVQNLDNVPFPDRGAFSRIGSLSTPPPNAVHDRMTFRLGNAGNAPLTITALTISGPWTLINPPSLPLIIPAGGQSDIQVLFQSETGAVATGTLTIQSDDPGAPTKVVELAGFWQSIPEGGQEPTMVEISKVLGYETIITGGQPINQKGELRTVGEEVLSPYWVRAASSSPVTVRQLAAFHKQDKSAPINWYVKGRSGTINPIFTHASTDAQTLLPRIAGKTGPAVGTFSPTGIFGFKVDGEVSDEALNDHTKDVANGGVEPVGHHMRFWPARDRAGTLIQNTWLMSMDYAGINYDYQDNVYLVTNMRPEIPAADPNIGGLYPGSPKLILDFNTSYPGSLTDSAGATIGFTSTQRNRSDSTLPSATTSYAPASLSINPFGQGTLSITTSSGTNEGKATGANTLVNGTELTFDGRTAKFTVAGTLSGPVDNLNSGVRQGGIMFGPNQDNFIKLSVTNVSGTPSIHFYSEQNGVKKNIGTKVPVTNASAVKSLELNLFCDAGTGTVSAGYHIIYQGSDGGLVRLPTSITLTGTQRNRFFAPKSKAGIIASSFNATSTVVTFDRFAILSASPTVLTGPALYRLDVAGATPYTDMQGNLWSRDTGFFTPSTAIAEKWGTPAISNTEDDPIYHTYRANVGGSTPQAERILSYNLPVANGTVDLRLHFAEVYWGAPGGAPGAPGPGKRVFDVAVNGEKVLQNFDITAAAGGISTALIVPIDGQVVTDGNVKIDFTASVDFGAISGIEVFSSGP